MYASGSVTETVTGPGRTSRALVPHKPQLSPSCRYLSAVNTESTFQQVQQTSVIHIQLASY